ncbi:MAG TPA: NADP-dependent oxidoreductase [Tepidisphaeraceae bacterium]|jgi:NADPH:quinone reductase-like Zn-dependent oxidoreductase|nr:NADP-dependent oxidoreductase [Tepidisphaeraceae bacterium]
MKASVIHQYGGPEVLKFEDYADPAVAEGQVLIRVAATSINPVDIGRRSGRMKEIFPIKFPGIIGVDLAGTIVKLGAGVDGFSIGDKVFAIADWTYAESCAVPAANLAKIPEGLDLIEAAALPMVTTTGNMLIVRGTGIKSGQTVLITGAVGNVGRSAVYTAKQRGAVVIAGVLGRQLQQAASLGVDQTVATDDEQAIAKLSPLDAVADTVAGKTAATLLGKVEKGGVFASVLGPPANAKDYPSVRIVPVYSKPDPRTLTEMARAVVEGKLAIPIGRKLPLSSAAEGHAAVEKRGIGKVLLMP